MGLFDWIAAWAGFPSPRTVSDTTFTEFSLALDRVTQQTPAHLADVKKLCAKLRSPEMDLPKGFELLRNKLRSGDPDTVLACLEILDKSIKLCGKPVQTAFLTEACMRTLSVVLYSYGSPHVPMERFPSKGAVVRNRLLEILICWNHALPTETQFGLVKDLVVEFRDGGCQFPCNGDSRTLQQFVRRESCRCGLVLDALSKQCGNCNQYFCSACCPGVFGLPESTRTVKNLITSDGTRNLAEVGCRLNAVLGGQKVKPEFLSVEKPRVSTLENIRSSKSLHKNASVLSGKDELNFNTDRAALTAMRSLLDRLASDTYDTISSAMSRIPFDVTENRLRMFIDMIFQKVQEKPNLTDVYAQLCRKFRDTGPLDATGKVIPFHELLAERVRQCFGIEKAASHARGAADGPAKLPVEFLKFIVSLQKMKVLSDPVILDCLQSLLPNGDMSPADDQRLECLCVLLWDCLPLFRIPDHHPGLSLIYECLRNLIDRRMTSPEVRKLMQSAIELRVNNRLDKWTPDYAGNIDVQIRAPAGDDEYLATARSFFQPNRSPLEHPAVLPDSGPAARPLPLKPGPSAENEHAPKPAPTSLVAPPAKSHGKPISGPSEGDTRARPAAQQTPALRFPPPLPRKSVFTDSSMQYPRRSIFTNGRREQPSLASVVTEPRVFTSIFSQKKLPLTVRPSQPSLLKHAHTEVLKKPQSFSEISIAPPSERNIQTKTNPSDLGTLPQQAPSAPSSHCDVILRSNDGKQVPAQSAVLRARAPAFATVLFEDPGIISSQKFFEVQDMDRATLYYFVQFLNGRDGLQIGPAAEDLLVIADKYGQEGLKTLCARELHKSMTSYSAGRILLLASRYGLEELKSSALLVITNVLIARLRVGNVRNFDDVLLDLAEVVLGESESIS